MGNIGVDKDEPDCSWYMGSDPPRCMFTDACLRQPFPERTKCITGDGYNPTDEYFCAGTCGQMTGCADCLNYQLFDRTGGSDCVWRVHGNNPNGYENDCVYHKWCDESGSKKGKCVRSEKK